MEVFIAAKWGDLVDLSLRMEEMKKEIKTLKVEVDILDGEIGAWGCCSPILQL